MLIKVVKILTTYCLGVCAAARAAIEWHCREQLSSRPHKLAQKLIVSLTSYPPRFNHLERTLRCLLNQTLQADHVILWIAHGDMDQLPHNVTALTKLGLEIESCEDVGSYKKIIPALRKFPDAVIVTADDDLYYRRTWLEELTESYVPARGEVVCHRAHRIMVTSEGLLQYYADWKHNTGSNEASQLVFPTSGAGALYAPGMLHVDVTRADLFTELAPKSDDVWLFWMAARNGMVFRKVGPRRLLYPWPGSQQVGLRHVNFCKDGGNDVVIAKMVKAFGFPPRTADGRSNKVMEYVA